MLTDIGADRDEVITRSKTDLNFFAAVCLPEVYAFPFPPIFLAIWQMLLDDINKTTGQSRLCIGLPRGFGKTILLKLYVIFLVLFSDRKFIVVICNTATLAENFLADVADVLSSPNIIRIFGDWRIGSEVDNKGLKKFTFKGRPVTLAALGSGSSLRGLNIKYVRPDAIIMDDMQSREEAESEEIARQSLVWMLGTLLKANNKARCQSIFVGNMYPFEGSILKKLKTNPGWVSFICGAILEDGESIWPELRSVEDILDELENDTSMGHPEIFFSEVMNDEEAGSRAGIDISRITYFSEDSATDGLPLEAEAGFVIIDPSVGKKKNDAVAIGVVQIFSGMPVLWDLKVDAFNPKQQIEESLAFAVKYRLQAVLVESVAYQATLVFWMREAQQRYGLTGLNIFEIYPGVNQKTSRILNMFKMLVSPQRQLALHPRVKARVIYQITHFNPLRAKNTDDILDLLAYTYPAINQFGAALSKPFEVTHSTEPSYTEDFEIPF